MLKAPLSILLTYLVCTLFVNHSLCVEAVVVEDASTSTVTPTKSLGSAGSLKISNAHASYVQFDLSGLPAGTTSDQVQKASLRLWVNKVTKFAVMQVFTVSDAWNEETITASSSPTIQTPAQIDVSVPPAAVKQFVTVDVTSVVRDWVEGVLPNNGLALRSRDGATVAFDSKESIAGGHEPTIDITLANSGPPGPKGEKGDTGAQGAQGIQGEPGAIGPQGSVGAKGDTGAQGIAGPKGDQGSQGVSGIVRSFTGTFEPIKYDPSAEWRFFPSVNGDVQRFSVRVESGQKIFLSARVDIVTSDTSSQNYLFPELVLALQPENGGIQTLGRQIYYGGLVNTAVASTLLSGLAPGTYYLGIAYRGAGNFTTPDRHFAAGIDVTALIFRDSQ